LGRTLLHWAAANGHQKIVEIFLQHKEVKSTRDRSGSTPCDMAATHGYKDIVKLFVDNDPHMDVLSTLREAAAAGHLEIVKIFPEEVKNNQSDEDFETPLHSAAEMGHLEVCKYFHTQMEGEKNPPIISENCSARQMHFYGWTPLHFAASKDHLKVIQYFLKELVINMTVDCSMLRRPTQPHKCEDSVKCFIDWNMENEKRRREMVPFIEKELIPLMPDNTDTRNFEIKFLEKKNTLKQKL
jgi:ankyrin repeat protein